MSTTDVPACPGGFSGAVRVVWGKSALSALEHELDALHRSVGSHAMARTTWLRACLDHDDRYTPLSIVVPGPQERLEAAALLAVRFRGWRREVVALGHGRSDATAFPARSPAAAAALADAVVGTVRSLRRPWTVTVRHLGYGDPVAARIAASLRHGWLVEDEVSPCLRFTPGGDLRSYVGKHYVKNRRRRIAKLAALGTPVETSVLRDADGIAAALPEIVEIGRKRDRAMGRANLSDTTSGAGLFRDAVVGHARRGEMLLVAARIEGELVGYALCFVDREVLRVWNCRFDPAWGDYGIGQICRSALIEHAIAEGMGGVDWMLGNEPYKAALSNGARRAEDLFGASGPLMAAVTRLALAVRAHARAATEDDADPPLWVRIVRRVGRPLLGS